MYNTHVTFTGEHESVKRPGAHPLYHTHVSFLGDHESVKRPGAHPAQSVDNSDEQMTEKKLELSEEPDFGVSIVIGSLLVIPVLVIIIIVVFLRVRKKCKYKDYRQGKSGLTACLAI